MATYTHSEINVPSGLPWIDVFSDLGPWNPISTSSSTIVLAANSDGTQTRLIGSFVFLSGSLISGTVTSVRHTSSTGATIYEEISGLSKSATALRDLSPSTPAEFFAALLGGADALNGYSGTDYLWGGPGGDALNGGAGTDFADYSGVSAGLTASLGDPGTNRGDAVGDTYVAIEGIRGSGFADILSGDGGANVINGGAGNDQENGGDGSDTVNGEDGDDQLAGGIGNDTLDGGAGNDSLVGGPGDDTYIVDSNTDSVTEVAGEGTDTVRSTAPSYTLAGQVENLVLLGSGNISGTGNAIVNVITGNGGNNTLVGGDGNDTLDGGAGNDTLIGGPGDDTYFVDSNSDSITEVADGGMDTVRSTAPSYILPGQVENLVLLGLNISGTGNALANVMTGSPGNNTLDGRGGDDTLIGGNGDDTLHGDVGADALDGGIGTDLADYLAGVTASLVDPSINTLEAAGDTYVSIEGLSGGGGDDVFYGDAGNNVLRGGGGFDLLYGGDGNDQLVSGFGTPTLYGGDGNDSIDATQAGLPTAYGEAGNDSLIGGSGTDTFYGGSGDDFASGGGGNDTISGEDCDDRLVGGSGDDNLFGGEGNDTLDGADGNNALDGGLGDDTYVLGVGSLAIVDSGGIDTILSTVGTFSLASFPMIENLTLGGGGAGTGNDLDNVIAGNSDNNALEGVSGNDVLDGGSGEDALDGGVGFDTATYASAGVGITANLDLGIGAGNDAAGDTYISVEALVGSDFDDTLVGKAGVANTLSGGDGDDFLYGEGVDTFSGGSGNDVLFGGQGAALNINLATSSIETVWGSFVGDVMNGSTSSANLTMVGQGLTGGANAETMTGGSGNDFIYYRAGDIVTGGAGNDWAVATLSASGVNLDMNATGFENAWGSTSDDTITAAGSASAAVMVGDTGADTLTGGNVSDFLYGFAGNDTLNGGAGNDNLIGGADTDTFAFGAGWGTDIVWDWVDGVEKFNLQGSGAANFGALTVDQNFAGSGNAYITFGTNHILVVGGANQIDGGDFIF